MSDPIIVSYSELDSYRQCPLKHLLGYKERWTKPLEPDDRRTKGTLYHRVLEVHYRTLMELQTKFFQSHNGWMTYCQTHKDEILFTLRQAVQPLLYQMPSGEQTEQQELIEWMYDGYVENYGVDPHWQILAVEHQIIEPLRDANGRRTRYHLKTKIDLIVKDLTTNQVWLIDHKSGQNLPTEMDLEIDDQFGLYTWALRQRGIAVVGAIHSANRTTRNQGDFPDHEPRFKPQSLSQRMSRTYLNRTAQELKNLALDALNVARHAYPPPSKQLPLYSSPDPRQCGWKCDFKEPHLAMRTGREPKQVMKEFGFIQDFTRH